jgi:arylsulfatase A-like enzyme
MNSTQPNIVLINCDDLGYGDLGCYGSERNDTPYLDKMAEEGIRFTDFYVGSAVCSPSRAALMTGCYPPRIGLNNVLFPGEADGLNPDEITVAKVLKQAGYSTKIVGKWHCGDQPEFLPTNHGFDDYFGLPYSNDMGCQAGREDTERFPPLPLMRGDQVHQQQPDQRGLTERYTDECLQFIKENKERPFFLYLAHMYVHVPLFVPSQFLEKSRNGGYGGAVACIDWAAGVIMDTLKREGLDENTLVIFTSDNGSRARDEGGSNAPCRGTKATTWEGGQRVPCIMRWPGTIEPGRVCTGIAAAMDFYPTFAKLAGASIPTDRIIDGMDFSEVVLNGAESPRDTFVYHFKGRLEAVRKGPWKLHVWKNGEEINELYKLSDDPGETANLVDDFPETVLALRALADEARADLGDLASGVQGANVRPLGKVDNPKTLTEYDEEHPYMVAMYDLADSKVMAG